MLSGPRGCVEGVKERGLIGADNPEACERRGEESSREAERVESGERGREREREKDAEKKGKRGIGRE